MVSEHPPTTAPSYDLSTFGDKDAGDLDRVEVVEKDESWTTARADSLSVDSKACPREGRPKTNCRG